MHLLQASTHQGSSRFRSQGRQCMSNSIAAILETYKNPINTWTTDTINNVLIRGDDLHCCVSTNGHEYMLLDDYPSQLEGYYYYLHRATALTDTTLCGTTEDGSPNHTLENALLNVFVTCHGNRCVLTVGGKNPSYSMAVIEENNKYYIFDPHSRNESGMPSADGTAVVTGHENISAVVLFIRHLSASLDKCRDIPFELVSVSCSVELTNNNSDFEGFSEFSFCDSDHECKIASYLAGNLSECLSDDCSDVSSVDVNSGNDSTNISDINIVDDLGNLNDSNILLQAIDLDILDEYGLAEVSTPLETAAETQQGVARGGCGSAAVSGDVETSAETQQGVASGGCGSAAVSGDVETSADTQQGVASGGCGSAAVSGDVETSADTQQGVASGGLVDGSVGEKESIVIDEIVPRGLRARKRKSKSDYESEMRSESDTDYDNDLDKDYKPSTSDDEDDSYDSEDAVPLTHFVTESCLPEVAPERRVRNIITRQRKPKRNVAKRRRNAGANDSEPEDDIPLARYRSNGEVRSDNIGMPEVEEVAPTRGRGRKRVRCEREWKRNVAKRRKNQGKSYESTEGKQRHAKVMKNGCGWDCKYKCKHKFSHEDRLNIFHSYWQLGCTEKQKSFLAKFAIRSKKKVSTTAGNSSRNYSVRYFFPTDESQKQVCKDFFLDTLSISESRVKTVHQKLDDIGVCGEDGQGKHDNRPNKTAEQEKEWVRNHIESYKCIQSHYCRKDTEKCYLDASLNVSKMHQNYVTKCEENSVTPVSITIYRKIFTEEYNISFHFPLKDQCDECFAFKHLPNVERENKKKEYEIHLINKEKARESRDNDKKKAELDRDGEFCSGCFDHEEVFLTPNSFNSSLYFKRRLNSFNLTVYEYGSKAGFCYIWNESIGARGGCEIASCVHNYIKRKAQEGKKEFVLYSDNCIAQNKNKYYMSMLWYCMGRYKLRSIVHKYLIKGHTQNEADSIHAGIEASVKNIPIYTTGQWAGIVRTSRTKQPYEVKEMATEEFLNFKDLSSMLKNFDINTENEKVYWNNIKLLTLTSDYPNQFFYQNDYGGEMKVVELFKRLRAKDIPKASQINLQPLRTEPIPISREKYRDLISLCRAYLIPQVHHPFYCCCPMARNLPVLYG